MNQNTFPPQHQDQQPGIQSEMTPQPISISPSYQGSGKLKNKVALITGGDSGIGRAVALAYAKEGADVAFIYLDEHGDAADTQKLIEETGQRCLSIAGNVGNETFCQQAVSQVIETFGSLHILVNNAAEQHVCTSITDITAEQLENTFRTNVFAYFYMVKAALPYLKNGSSIINTTSVTAYKGNEQLLDYSSSKGAIVAFIRSLSQSLVQSGIRVNGVAPGPIWTPFIPSTFSAYQVVNFGTDTPMKRAGQPAELAPGYVYLASDDSSYMTGQVLHINGGIVVGG